MVGDRNLHRGRLRRLSEQDLHGQMVDARECAQCYRSVGAMGGQYDHTNSYANSYTYANTYANTDTYANSRVCTI